MGFAEICRGVSRSSAAPGCAVAVSCPTKHQHQRNAATESHSGVDSKSQMNDARDTVGAPG